MKNIYNILKEWANENSKWFMNTENWFKFETENKSFYVFPANNGNAIEIEVCEKGGSFVSSSRNLPAVSWAKSYIKEMENE